MLDVFDCGAVLFESGDEEEALRIECAVTQDGKLEIIQESDGPLTQWCFEESPHRLEVEVSRINVQGLLDYFHLDEVRMLPAVLRMEYTGYNCFARIRKLMRNLEIPYNVLEHDIVR